MRHLNRSVHLNRTSSHRRALFSNLSVALFTHKRITTTLAKAKYTRQYAERLITFARRGGLADRRHVLKYITDKSVVKTLFDDLGVHFKNRDGGYTRIIKLGFRRGDAAPMAILELVGFDDVLLEASKGTSRLKASQSKAVDEKISDADIASAEEADVSEVETEDTTAIEDSSETTEATETMGSEATETDKSDEVETASDDSASADTEDSDAEETDKKE